MIDIHCHILPALDDGPNDIGESMRMFKIAADDGVTHIVATPHFSYSEGPTGEDIRRSRKNLEEKVREEGIPVKLLGGADIKLTYELVEGIDRNDVITINDSRYFLLELPDVLLPNLEKFLFKAVSKGFVPIVTHPERNYGLLTSPVKMGSLRDSGTLFQLTAMSITGEFGDQIKRFSHVLLKKGFVDFIASDAHDPVRRRPVLSRAYKEVSALLGKKTARGIFFENPEAVIENREINT